MGLKLNLRIIDGSYSICKLDASSEIPDWALKGDFYSITKTEDELSIVCESKNIPAVSARKDFHINENSSGKIEEKKWGLIKVEGPLDLNLTGVSASLLTPLAKGKINIFAVSTYDTDYLLVKIEKLQVAKQILEKSGFNFV